MENWSWFGSALALALILPPITNCFATIATSTRDGSVDTQHKWRLKFLGGFVDPTDPLKHDMCFQYQLHYRGTDILSNVNDMKIDTNHSKIKWWMQICDNNKNTVSDYLKSVDLDSSNNETNYYVDDTHFYYQTSLDLLHLNQFGNGTDSNVITLCFTDNINNIYDMDEDLLDKSLLKMIVETDYCVTINNDDEEYEHCNKRSVYVPDVCSEEKSIARLNSHLPVAAIDYVPEKDKQYELSLSGVFFFSLLKVFTKCQNSNAP